VGERAYQRRTRLVDRQFQVGLAWRLLLVMAMFFVAGIALAFAPSAIALMTGSDLKSIEPAAEEFLVLHRRIWPAAILSFAGVFAYCLIFSHRIAGSVYRIDAVLRQLLRDEYPAPVQFRKNDYFHPTAQLLSELSRKLAEQRAGQPPAGGRERKP
jgi:hypothetical protein